MLTISSLVAQTLDFEAGKMCLLNLKSGRTVKARITGVTEQQITCRVDDRDETSTFQKSEIANVVPIKYAVNGSFGVGPGVAYGTMGVNGEFAVVDFLILSAGLGTTIFAGSAYAIGGRIYMKPPGEKWCPRFSDHYGTNSVISVTGARQIQEKFQGLSLQVKI